MGLFSWFKSNATPQTKEEVVAHWMTIGLNGLVTLFMARISLMDPTGLKLSNQLR